jgi:hypothetical protein
MWNMSVLIRRYENFFALFITSRLVRDLSNLCTNLMNHARNSQGTFPVLFTVLTVLGYKRPPLFYGRIRTTRFCHVDPLSHIS